MDSDFCVEALEGALRRYGRPEIFNTDQGSSRNNVFVERLWRSLKYEEVYLNAYDSIAMARAGIGAWIDFYDGVRRHQGLGMRTPDQVYYGLNSGLPKEVAA